MIFSITEKILLKQLAFGNQAAFIRLYNLHTEAIYLLAMQLTAGDKPVAEKIVQHSWNDAVRKLSGHSLKSSLRKWLVSIVVYYSREHYSREKRYMLIDDNFPEVLAERMQKVKYAVAMMCHEEAVHFLPIGYRHVFILHDIHACTHQEIANYLQISEGCSMNLLFKARKALRQLSEVNSPQKVNPHMEWTDSEMKKFRTAYRNAGLPNQLRAKVMNQLEWPDLIVPDYSGYSLVAE